MPPIGHVPLGHHLQQRRLHLGRRAVDLVGEHEVGHHRAQLDVELLAALPVDPGAEDVGGNQVRGELDAGERAADHPGEGLHSERLGHPGHALEQQVPPGQQADEHPLDQPVLPDDHPLDLEDRPLDELRIPGWGGQSAGMGGPAGRWRGLPAIGLTHGSSSHGSDWDTNLGHQSGAPIQLGANPTAADPQGPARPNRRTGVAAVKIVRAPGRRRA